MGHMYESNDQAGTAAVKGTGGAAPHQQLGHGQLQEPPSLPPSTAFHRPLEKPAATNSCQRPAISSTSALSTHRRHWPSLLLPLIHLQPFLELPILASAGTELPPPAAGTASPLLLVNATPLSSAPPEKLSHACTS
jgi:hypothetical protein